MKNNYLIQLDNIVKVKKNEEKKLKILFCARPVSGSGFKIKWILSTGLLFRRTKDQCYQRYTYSLRETIRKPNINIQQY